MIILDRTRLTGSLTFFLKPLMDHEEPIPFLDF